MNRSSALLLLSALAIASTACAVDIRGQGVEGTFSRTLTVDGPTQLDIETGSGEIDIETAESGPVKVEGRVSAGWNLWDGNDAAARVRAIEQSPPIEQSGNNIHIGRRPRWNNVRISYVVTVPRDTSLRAQTGSGDVAIGDLARAVSAETGSGSIRIGRIAGEVRGRTGSGDIELMEGTGGIRLSTGSGQVVIRRAGAGSSDVSTGSGDVEVAGAAGPLRVRTASGQIQVTGSPTAEWNLEAGSGDLNVETTTSAAFSVDVQSLSGDIDVRDVVSTGRATRHALRGTVRGGGPLVSMSTGSGEVRVR